MEGNIGFTVLDAPAHVVMLSGYIGEDNIKELIKYLIEASLQRHPDDPIHIIINSHGGEIDSAFAAIDVMNGCPQQIITYGIGAVESAALLIFMSGDVRVLTKNCSVLSHQFSTGIDSTKYSGLRSGAVGHALTHEKMVALYKECTGMSDDDINLKLLPSDDVWLTTADALAYKLCDAVFNEFHLAELNG
jgi:ATP-dependent Clp protease protease subunit